MREIARFDKFRKLLLERALGYIGSSSAWSPGLFLFFFLSLATLSFLTDAVLFSSFNPLWILVSGTAFLTPLLIGVIYKVGYLNRAPIRPRPLQAIAIAMLCGISRNVSVGALAILAGIEQDRSWLFRVFGGVIIGAMLFSLWALSNGSKIDYLQSLRDFGDTQTKLASIRKRIPEQIESTNQTLQQNTRLALIPQLDSIRKLLTADTNLDDALAKLRDTITNQIRPMIAEISAMQPKDIEIKPLEEFRKIDTRFPEHFILRDNIFVVWSSLIFYFPIQYWLLFLKVPNSWLQTLAMAAIYFSSLSAFKLIMPKRRKFKSFNAVFYLLLMSLSSSLIASAYLPLIIELGTEQRIGLVGITLFSGLIVPIFFLLSAVRLVKRQEIQAQIQDSLNSIAKENSLFAQRLWVFRKRWLLVLHGSVQSSLTAALNRLQSQSQDEAVVIELVKQDLARAAAAIQASLSEDLDLDEDLSQLQQVWAGICDVSVEISERARRALERSPDSRFCTNEIAKEAVSNAVRHGDASAAKVEIQRIEDDLIHIKVSNNGREPEPGNQLGIGSEMLNEICLEWKLTSKKRSVELQAELAVRL